MGNVKIHQTAEVQTSNIGEGTVIWQHVVILKGASIGNNCNINFNVFIENEVRIGDNVTIKSGTQIWDGITIENDVFIGPNVTFTNDLVPRSKQYPEAFTQTLIQKGCSIGANATIIAGNTLGAYSFIGAGSVVTKNIPAHHVYYGNPATHKGYVTKDGILLTMDGKDKNGIQYNLTQILG